MESALTETSLQSSPASLSGTSSKEFNTVSLCRIGQETVQDIVSRSQEVFQTLKDVQPPTLNVTTSDRRAKVQELLRTIKLSFKRLGLIYEKCNENNQHQGMQYTNIESLIPFKNDIEPYDDKKNTEIYRLVCEESNELVQQIVSQNKQLKEIIEHMRRIICEINILLTMPRF